MCVMMVEGEKGALMNVNVMTRRSALFLSSEADVWCNYISHTALLICQLAGQIVATIAQHVREISLS